MIKPKAMRFAILVLAALFTMTPLAAGEALDIEEATAAVNGIFAAVFSTAAAQVNSPPVSLDGVTVERELVDEQGRPAAMVTYLRSDVASMAERLRNPVYSGMSLFQRLALAASSRFSPLTMMAVGAVDALGWQQGDAILDGTIVFSAESAPTSFFDAIVSITIRHDWASVDFDVDVSIVVSGNAFSSPVAIEGRLSAIGDNSREAIVLTTEKMTCNNLPIHMEPMVFTIG